MQAECLNRVKKAKLKKKQMAAVVKEMEDALPVYTVEDIRRLQMPYHQAIACELKERGLDNTLEFLQQLIEYQEMQRKVMGESSSRRPRLVNSKDHLDILVEGLSKAEKAHKADNYVLECHEFLLLARKFSFDLDNWAWLGEQLILQSDDISRDFEGNALKYRAMSLFMHGKFALETSDNYELAIKYFENCKKLSMGMHWSAREYFPQYKKLLSEDVCIILYNIFYNKAKQLLKTSPKQAGRFANIAKKRALDACYMSGVTEAFLLKGITELVDNNLPEALKSMLSAFKLHLANDGAYDPRLKIAMERLRAGKTILALEILLVLRNSLDIDGLPYFIAQAYRYLGEIKLGQGEAQAATPLLVTALSIFVELKMISEIEQVRNLAAISSGQELMPKYTELIIKTNRKGFEGQDSMMALLAWKDQKEPFWNEDEASMRTGDSKSFEDVSEIISTLSVEEESEDMWEEEEQDEEEDDDLGVLSGTLKLGKHSVHFNVQGEQETGEVSKEPDEIGCSDSWLEEDFYYAIFRPDIGSMLFAKQPSVVISEDSESDEKVEALIEMDEKPPEKEDDDEFEIIEEYVDIQLDTSSLQKIDI